MTTTTTEEHFSTKMNFDFDLLTFTRTYTFDKY